MASIDINFREVKKAGYRLPTITSRLESAKREVGLLRWRVPEDILSKNDIQVSMESLVTELENISEKIMQINSLTENVVTTYLNTDMRLLNDLERFE